MDDKHIPGLSVSDATIHTILAYADSHHTLGDIALQFMGGEDTCLRTAGFDLAAFLLMHPAEAKIRPCDISPSHYKEDTV